MVWKFVQILKAVTIINYLLELFVAGNGTSKLAKIPFCPDSKVPFRVVLFLPIWCLVTMRTLLAIIAKRVEVVRRVRVGALPPKGRSEKLRKFKIQNGEHGYVYPSIN